MVKDDLDRLSVLRDALRRRLGGERFELWLGGRTRLELAGNTLRVTCASRAELQFLRRRLHHPLVESCHAALSPSPTIVFDEAEDADPAPRRPAIPSRSVRPPAAPSVCDAAAPTDSRGTSRRGFEGFALGASNRIAVQAARDVAHHPGRFTPLVLYGPAGCGKTHLLEAIERSAREARGRVRSAALTAEQFTAQFLDALNRRTLPSFRQKTRSVDLLLIDDLQFFDNKRATLEELLYTIDALHARQGQIAFTSDRPVADLHTISPELASRLASGLAVALDPPDYAVRLGIVRSMAERLRVDLPVSVVDHIARQVVGSARLLSGAINRLTAASAARGQAITLEFAIVEIADFSRQHAPHVRLPDIQRAVCELFGVDPATLRSQRRTRAIAEPRMLCMWLARRYTRAALSEIGDFFGGRSHSTVVSAKRKFDGLVSCGGEIVVGDRPCQIDEAVRRIEARLRTG